MHFEADYVWKETDRDSYDAEKDCSSYASECKTVKEEIMLEISEPTERTNTNSEANLQTTSILNCAVANVYKGSFDIVREELRLGRKIGEGEFGLVLKGVYRGGPCAVKMLKQGVKRDTLQYQRLLLELSILANIRPHANVVGFLGACIDDLSRPLIIEELVDGQNLNEYLAAKRDGFNLGQPKVRNMLVNEVDPGLFQLFKSL